MMGDNSTIISRKAPPSHPNRATTVSARSKKTITSSTPAFILPADSFDSINNTTSLYHEVILPSGSLGLGLNLNSLGEISVGSIQDPQRVYFIRLDLSNVPWQTVIPIQVGDVLVSLDYSNIFPLKNLDACVKMLVVSNWKPNRRLVVKRNYSGRIENIPIANKNNVDSVASRNKIIMNRKRKPLSSLPPAKLLSANNNPPTQLRVTTTTTPTSFFKRHRKLHQQSEEEKEARKMELHQKARAYALGNGAEEEGAIWGGTQKRFLKPQEGESPKECVKRRIKLLDEALEAGMDCYKEITEDYEEAEDMYTDHDKLQIRLECMFLRLYYHFYLEQKGSGDSVSTAKRAIEHLQLAGLKTDTLTVQLKNNRSKSLHHQFRETEKLPHPAQVADKSKTSKRKLENMKPKLFREYPNIHRKIYEWAQAHKNDKGLISKEDIFNYVNNELVPSLHDESMRYGEDGIEFYIKDNDQGKGPCHARTKKMCRLVALGGQRYCKIHAPYEANPVQMWRVETPQPSPAESIDRFVHRRLRTSYPVPSRTMSKWNGMIGFIQVDYWNAYRIPDTCPNEVDVHGTTQAPIMYTMFTGKEGQVQCVAISSRGRQCKYAVADSNDENCKYCLVHIDYETNPPKIRKKSGINNRK